MTTERAPTRLDRVAVAPRRREGVIGHTVAEEMVLFSTETETAVSLNLTAAAVWELCDGDATVERIIELLAEDAGVDPATIADDVEAILHQMESLSLLDLTRAGASDARDNEQATSPSPTRWPA